MFRLKILFSIFCATFVITHGRNGRNKRQIERVCSNAYQRCEVMDTDDILTMDEEGYSLNVSTASNDKLCQFASQVILCKRSLAGIPGCLSYSEHVIMPMDVINALISQLCHGHGRDDLDLVAICANNKFIQRYYYGKVMEIGGYLNGISDCRNRMVVGMTHGINGQEREHEVCSVIQGLFEVLPRLMLQYCGSETSQAVKRVMGVLRYEQIPLSRLVLSRGECRFLTMDMLQ